MSFNGTEVGPPVRVQVGIDAAVVANHHVCVREVGRDGRVGLTRFHVPPTRAGLARLASRLEPYPGVMAVVEPTSMTWLGLSVALERGGVDLALVGARHAARLRGAVTGKSKSDVIDADLLATAGEVFTLSPLRRPSPAELALRRAVTRRGKLVIDGNRSRRRLISLARWAFPDLWGAFARSMPTAVAVLGRWPDLRALASARRSTVTAVVAEHTRGVPDVPARVEAIRTAARGWVEFWQGHLDLDALAWEVSEHLADMRLAQEQIARATEQAQRYWTTLYGEDRLLLSLPGMGPMTAPTVRAFLGDGRRSRPPRPPRPTSALRPRRGPPGPWSSPRGRSPRKARRCCGWRFTKPQAVPGAPTPSSPPTTDT